MEAVKIELTLNGDVMNTLLELLADKVADKLAAKKADKEENEEESNKEEVKEEIPIRINTSTNHVRTLSTSNTTNTNNNITNTKAIDLNTSNKADNTDNNNTNNYVCNDCSGNTTNAKDLNTSNNTSTNAEVTMDQILGYMSQKGYKFDPKKFYNYYRGMGWKTKNGRDILPIWQQAIDTWARTEYDRGTYKAATTPNKVGMGTREERMAAHPFVPTDFNEFAPV